MRRRDAAGGARRGQTDGGGRWTAHRGARLRRLGHPRQRRRPVGRLAQLLGGLDGALAEFESGLGERWRDTVIVVATEFGRTARINGTKGTDHGTGTIALLAGGAVKGGRVIADWPGLKYANSSRTATSSRRPICAPCSKACCPIISVRPTVLAETVFPDSAAVKPMKGLVGA